jgi:hypothetical protein
MEIVKGLTQGVTATVYYENSERPNPLCDSRCIEYGIYHVSSHLSCMLGCARVVGICTALLFVLPSHL